MPDNPSKKSPTKKAKRSQRKSKPASSASKRQPAQPLSDEELVALQRDLPELREPTPAVRRQLERLAATDMIDLEGVKKLYNGLPGRVTKSLTYIVLLGEDKFNSVVMQLGENGKGLDGIRNSFMPLRPILRWLRNAATGIIDPWNRMSITTFYDHEHRYPMAEIWLYDSLGHEVYHSRSDVHEVGELGRAFLEVSADTINEFVEREIAMSAKFIENTRATLKRVRRICSDLERDLTRAQKREGQDKSTIVSSDKDLP